MESAKHVDEKGLSLLLRRLIEQAISVLSREVQVGLGYLRGKHESIMFVASGFS
jgi:hypothetical protein